MDAAWLGYIHEPVFSYNIHYFNTYLQVPRYSSLKALLSKVLQHFLSSNISPTSEAGVHSEDNAGVNKESMLKMGINLLDYYMLQFFPRNSKDKSKLIGFGYSSKLWDEVWH